MSKNGGNLTTQYNLRWSDELKEKIALSAKENTRSINQEVIARLEASYKNESQSIRDIPTEELMEELSFRFGGLQVSIEALKKTK